MTALDFNLVQIIKNSNESPADLTDRVWSEGYQRMNFTTEEIIEMATSQIADCIYFGVPYEVWPKTLEELSKGTLCNIIDDAAWEGNPAEIAATILKNGYMKGGDK